MNETKSENLMLVDTVIASIGNSILTYSDIPREYRDNKDVISACIKLGIISIVRIGYDISLENFYVRIQYTYNEKTLHSFVQFENFGEYYDFLSGEIYDNACYYQYVFSKEEISEYAIDTSRLNYIPTCASNINDYSLSKMLDVDEDKNREIEKDKSRKLQYARSFSECKSPEHISKMFSSLPPEYSSYFDLEFFLSYWYNQYMPSIEDILKVLSDNDAYWCNALICFALADYSMEFYNEFKKVSENIPGLMKKKKLVYLLYDILRRDCYSNELMYKAYFDSKTHFYCLRKNVVGQASRCWYFNTLDELAAFLNITNQIKSEKNGIVLTEKNAPYMSLDKPFLPMLYDKPKCRIEKKYLSVSITWEIRGITVAKTDKKFKLFSSYIAFLNYDLSNGDFLNTDVIDKLTDYSGINFTNAKLRSSAAVHIGLPIPEMQEIIAPIPNEVIIQNESQTESQLICDAHSAIPCRGNKKIFYLSDLHLNHRLKKTNCTTLYDIENEIRNIVSCIMDQYHSFNENMLLIVGDISSDFHLFKLFITCLNEHCQHRRIENIVFVLGNHELWPFSDTSIDSIGKTYEDLITENGMLLLQNSIILHKRNKYILITTEQIINLSCEELENEAKGSDLVLFGGIGFSGQNTTFNADNGIYCKAMGREDEIAESNKLYQLYLKVLPILKKHNSVVCTHMPLSDWAINGEYENNIVYVSGHTHKNHFYDDGDIRVYSDNQLGYKCPPIQLKYFYIDKSNYIFEDYEDGIHTITPEQYVDFCLSKGIRMDFNRRNNKLYMLKKKGYYMFIMVTISSNRESLNVLYGGSIKRLPKQRIEYFYANMDKVIDYIEAPLKKYSMIQKSISESIQKIGGDGYIHGAIVDIDFYNHIYFNPNDGTITPYWALDVVRKVVYPTVEKLLEEKAPEKFSKYKELMSTSALVPFENSAIQSSHKMNHPTVYLDTDIYSGSLEIKKMQRLMYGILGVWHEPKEM